MQEVCLHNSSVLIIQVEYHHDETSKIDVNNKWKHRDGRKGRERRETGRRKPFQHPVLEHLPFPPFLSDEWNAILLIQAVFIFVFQTFFSLVLYANRVCSSHFFWLNILQSLIKKSRNDLYKKRKKAVYTTEMTPMSHFRHFCTCFPRF